MSYDAQKVTYQEVTIFDRPAFTVTSGNRLKRPKKSSKRMTGLQ